MCFLCFQGDRRRICKLSQVNCYRLWFLICWNNALVMSYMFSAVSTVHFEHLTEAFFISKRENILVCSKNNINMQTNVFHIESKTFFRFLFLFGVPYISKHG